MFLLLLLKAIFPHLIKHYISIECLVCGCIIDQDQEDQEGIQRSHTNYWNIITLNTAHQLAVFSNTFKEFSLI